MEIRIVLFLFLSIISANAFITHASPSNHYPILAASVPADGLSSPTPSHSSTPTPTTTSDIFSLLKLITLEQEQTALPSPPPPVVSQLEKMFLSQVDGLPQEQGWLAVATNLVNFDDSPNTIVSRTEEFVSLIFASGFTPSDVAVLLWEHPGLVSSEPLAITECGIFFSQKLKIRKVSATYTHLQTTQN